MKDDIDYYPYEIGGKDVAEHHVSLCSSRYYLSLKFFIFSMSIDFSRFDMDYGCKGCIDEFGYKLSTAVDAKSLSWCKFNGSKGLSYND